MDRYFGKCGACKAPVVVDARPLYLIGSGDSVEVAPHQWVRSQNMTTAPFHAAAAAGYIVCRCGHPVRKFAQLQGRYSERHRCGARCLNSQGPNCDCQCGGKNHGSGHIREAA